MKLSAGRIEEDQTGAMDNDEAGGGNSFLGFPKVQQVPHPEYE